MWTEAGDMESRCGTQDWPAALQQENIYLYLSILKLHKLTTASFLHGAILLQETIFEKFTFSRFREWILWLRSVVTVDLVIKIFSSYDIRENLTTLERYRGQDQKWLKNCFKMYGTATGSNYFNSYSSLEPEQALRMNGDGRTLSGLY